MDVEFSRLLQELGFKGDCTPAKLAWALNLKSGQRVVAFVVARFAELKQRGLILDGSEVEAFGTLQKKGAVLETIAEVRTALQKKNAQSQSGQSEGGDEQGGEALKVDVARLRQEEKALRARVEKLRRQRDAMNEETAQVKERQARLKKAQEAERAKHALMLGESVVLCNKTLNERVSQTCILASRLLAQHRDDDRNSRLYAFNPLEEYVVAESGCSEQLRLFLQHQLLAQEALRDRHQSERFVLGNELVRLQTVLPKTRMDLLLAQVDVAKRKCRDEIVAAGVLAGAAGGGSSGEVKLNLSQLKKQLEGLYEQLSQLWEEEVRYNVARVQFADHSVKLVQLQQLFENCQFAVGVLKQQQTRHALLVEELQRETELLHDISSSLNTVLEVLEGVLFAHRTRLAHLAQAAAKGLDTRESIPEELLQSLLRALQAACGSQAQETSAASLAHQLVAQGKIDRDARRAQSVELQTLVTQLDGALHSVWALLCERDPNTRVSSVRWVDPELLRLMETARTGLAQATEMVGVFEKKRVDAEVELKSRPAELVYTERSMMQLFWEDPTSTTKLNATLAKLKQTLEGTAAASSK